MTSWPGSGRSCWVRIGKEYRFDTDGGIASLADLFRGRSQLLIYHFMMGPDYAAGCPSCSAIADGFDGSVVHLANHDVAFSAVSRAPLAKLRAYKQRMGWSFPWVSSGRNDFNYDFGVSVPGLNAGPSQPEMERAGPDRTDLPSYNFTKRPFGAENPGVGSWLYPYSPSGGHSQHPTGHHIRNKQPGMERAAVK